MLWKKIIFLFRKLYRIIKLYFTAYKNYIVHKDNISKIPWLNTIILVKYIKKRGIKYGFIINAF